MASVKAVHEEPDQIPSKETSQEPCPTFGPCPDTKVADFNFETEMEHLPFKFNLGDITLDKEHQGKFIDMIYSNQELFSLHDEDRGDCNQLIHTMTSTSKPAYLPHRTIPRKLQEEVHKCLRTWLCQGINHPCNSPHGSQVVIVHKKSWKIHLCVDYRKLNSITIRDAFPLPSINKAL